jgi:2-C-methyl-D-erythritol 4-phosphate cytidylyltransferase
MIEWSIDAFRACDSVRSIVVATPPACAHDLEGDDLTLVTGGATRAQSVASALAAVDTELVAIHDAARPLLTPGLAEELIASLAAAADAAGVIAAAPVYDTIKRVDTTATATRSAFGTEEGQNALLAIDATLDRSTLWAAQTPQVFRVDALRAALDANPLTLDTGTDEAMLVEAAGATVLIHPTAAENFKVTTPLDLRVAELLLAERRASAPE